MNRYISTLDKTSRIISWSVGGLAVIIFIIGYFSYLKSGKEPVVIIGLIVGPLLLSGLMITMYLLMPKAIEINDSGITIDRKLSPLSINFADIKSIRPLLPGEMKGVIRAFGNGGLFGYTGMYYNKKLGSMAWYCTQRKNYILVEKASNKTIVITPDDPELFMKDIHTKTPWLTTP